MRHDDGPANEMNTLISVWCRPAETVAAEKQGFAYGLRELAFTNSCVKDKPLRETRQMSRGERSN